MKNMEFNKCLTQWNGRYKELFGVIPCINEYSCTREEYLIAIQRAVEEGRMLGEYLIEREG